MTETRKVLLVGVVMALSLVVILTFQAEPPRWIPSALLWSLRIGVPTAMLGIIALVAWMTVRRDKAPDFLRRLGKGAFEKDGFCFKVSPNVRQGICHLNVIFQNRYEKRCRARVVIKPRMEFWVATKKLEHIGLCIECVGGGFGVARVPWPVPRQYQGKLQDFDVAASVEFPDGRGKMLRFRDGASVGSCSGDWRIPFTLVAASVGAVVISRSARASLLLPFDVAESVSGDAAIIGEILWRPGDHEQIELDELRWPPGGSKEAQLKYIEQAFAQQSTSKSERTLALAKLALLIAFVLGSLGLFTYLLIKAIRT